MDLIFQSAKAITRMILSGDVSAREVLSAHLDQIDRFNDAVNAVVAIDRADAFRTADDIDTRLADGEPVGILAGVPITIKEAFDCRGLPATCGMARYRSRVAIGDAPAVATLRQADAVIIGKSNVPTQLQGHHSINPLYGETKNPWDTRRAAGGSSGGSAAAVASGFSVFDLASDLHGSIRLPASWCGVIGFRPSPGFISKRGHLPWPPHGQLEPPASVAGPIARSIEDIQLAVRVLSRGAIGNSYVGSHQRPTTINVWAPSPELPVDSETYSVISDAVDLLARHGWRIRSYRPPMEIHKMIDLGWRLAKAEITRGLTEEQWSEQLSHPIDVRTYLADLESQLQLKTLARDSLEPDALLLSPATPTPSIRTDEIGMTIRLDGDLYDAYALWSWSLATSVMQLPSATLPTPKTADGLPIGVQITAAPGQDDRLLNGCANIMDTFGPVNNPPMDNLIYPGQ
ncbi:amidase [Ferrimicrobium sp.]|jgi:amidase|uniref:amidase n=1 Tax=Ferrimicrobium sp. TaxID=2926050 RepID=UPI002619AFC8|nr:amidase [Ferrimicrobium sp.]MCL5973446.1 amidase [Actinomycetota bacterium]